MNEQYCISTFNCEMVLDRFFFVSSDMNMILEYSLDKDEIFFLPPPDENMFEIGLYGNIVAFNDLIFLIPFNAKNLWKLSNKNGWKKISGLKPENGGKFLGAISIDKYIYLLGFGHKEIYKLNALTFQITELKIDNKQNRLALDDVGFLGSDYEIVKGKIFVPVMCENKILEIDPETDLISEIDVPSKSNGYSGIVYDGIGFWLAPRKGQYFVHYLLNGTVEEYKLPEEYNDNKMYFGSAYREKNHIIFTAFFGKNFKFNIKYPNEYKTFEPSIYYCKMLNNKGKVIHERNGKTYYVDVNGNIRKLNLLFSNTDRLEYIKRYANRKMIITEKKTFALNEYLNIVEHCWF